jgi:hypothetical protein
MKEMAARRSPALCFTGSGGASTTTGSGTAGACGAVTISAGGGGSRTAGTAETVTLSNLTTVGFVTTTASGVLSSEALTPQCEMVWGGTATSNALQSGDDAIEDGGCFNKTGHTWTITSIYCSSDAASGAPTVNPTFGAAGTGTSVLGGALTCGTSNGGQAHRASPTHQWQMVTALIRL